MKLSPYTQIMLIDPTRGYIGFNTLNNLTLILADKYQSFDVVHDILKTLEDRSYITSQDTQDYPYWVVSKAVPRELREDVRNNKITLVELLPQLEV